MIHCTMRLSIELENFQILKSKGLVFAQFWSKYDNSSADWWKTGQNLKEKYSHHIFVQNEAVICKKNLLLVSDKLQIRHTSKLPYAEKKPQNNFFIRGQEHCENGIWNIQIFFTFFHNLKIFDVRFEASVQLVPTILFTSFLQPASIETDPIANPPSAVDHIQLVPKYISKVKLERGWSPNILSEIMWVQENGSEGFDFA